MGCGCRGNNNTKRKLNTTKFYSIPYSTYKSRKKVCLKCPYINKISSTIVVRNCTKINKPIGFIIRDPYFKCPIGKFKSVT